MAGFSTGFKKKLIITALEVGDDGDVTKLSDPKPFELMLNPSSFSYERAISYAKEGAIGSIGSDSKFQCVPPGSVSFDFVIDGTGVCSLPIPGMGVEDVTTQLENLAKVVYEYRGESHEPNVVQLLWGTFLYVGRMKSMKTDYTLFKPSGDPLRAKVNLAFSTYMSTKEEALEKDNQSPDLSHRVVFRDGDTLPLMCYRIYKDSGYYAEVANYNNLVDFRNIAPGTEITFPPLR